ncbi:MAG: HAMP domain-containing histidine kinase, partial [Bacilli bacterium]|nr:HAMP domain-containing histidine kinase [Bacilli bacterium]
NALFKLTHEIKNPIAVCKGYLDMINLDNVDKSKKYINIIKSEIDRSLNVITDFMDYSKIKINREEFDMIMLLDEIYDSFSLLTNNKNILFNYHNNYEEIYLMGDYERLKQVFVNIIKNSIESIESNGIIDIDILLREQDVIITISDNGVGMTAYELDNIKEMFYTTKKNGTGLGVALSNEIIVSHNGKMEYVSEKNKGTKCTITLPL